MTLAQECGSEMIRLWDSGLDTAQIAQAINARHGYAITEAQVYAIVNRRKERRAAMRSLAA